LAQPPTLTFYMNMLTIGGIGLCRPPDTDSRCHANGRRNMSTLHLLVCHITANSYIYRARYIVPVSVRNIVISVLIFRNIASASGSVEVVLIII